ncbi:MAG TPA: hypothetical protein VM534_05865 [Thermoanaerobaculia bacterium]|nr:hypothetical protein [Thermoanaerobaculia bacterium]
MSHPLFVLAMVMFPLLQACSSAGDTPANLIPPRIQVRQLSGQMEPGSYRQEAQVNLIIDVFNDSSEAITLKRLRIQSIIGGQMEFGAAERLFDLSIPAGGSQTVDIWVDAYTSASMLNADPRMMVRGTAVFDSPFGPFRRVFTEPILEFTRGGANPR